MSASGTTIRSAFADAFARRAAFWSQAAVMVTNDCVWVLFWLIFFDRTTSVRGWDADAVLLLLATLTTSGGIVLGLLANCRRIPYLVQDGALDEVLALPVSPLPHLLVRRVEAVHLGDTLFGLALFLLAGAPTLARTAVFMVGVAGSVVLLTGFLVAVGSSVFFAGRAQGADLGLHAIILLASYPADIFAGATKTLLYTALPAAFVATVPARLIYDFSAGDAVALALAAAAFAALGWVTFSLGLRRYTSGSAWARA